MPATGRSEGGGDSAHARRLAEAVLDAAREPLFRFDPNGRLGYANEAACRALGYRREELAALTLSDIEVDFPPSKVAALWAALRADGAVERQGRYRRRDGGEYPVALGFRRLEVDGEEFAIVSARGLSAEKEAPLAPGESEARLNEALRIARMGEWHLDLIHDRLSYSDQVYDLLGVERGKFAPSPSHFEALVHPDDREKFQSEVKNRAFAPEILGYEHRIVRPDGRVLYVEQRNEPIFDATGAVIARRGTIQDITARKEIELALRLAQRSLDASREALFRCAVDGRILYANPAACLSLGYSEEEMLELGVSDINVDITPDILAEQWRELRQTGAISLENRHRRKDGGIFPVKVTVSYVKRGGTEFSFVSARDVSEERLAEERLEQVEQRFALARRNARIGTWEWNIQEDSAEWSRETFLIYGYEPGSVQPSYEMFEERVHPGDREPLHAAERDAFASGADFYETEFRVVMPDGEIKHVHDSGVITRDARGTAVYMTGIVQDISERKAAAQALAESERLYRNILDNMVDTYYRIDHEGRIVMASRSAALLLGYSLEELIGRPLAELYGYPEQRDEFLGLLAASEGEVIGFEAQMVRKEGTLAWVSTNARYWRDADGKVLGVEGTARDVTGAREVAEQLRQAQKMEAVGQLTGGIAHDFNNLLTVVMGNLELVADELADDSRARDLVSRAYRAAKRGANLTHRLLAFSRKQTLLPTLVDLNQLVANLTDMLGVTLGDSVRLTFHGASDLWPCWADRSQLENSILNLAINARDAMPAGGALTIATRNAVLDDAHAAAHEDAEAGEYVMFSISDTGHGIPRDALDHVFEPFYTTKDVGAGSGLGLSMIYGFARQSGGHVTIESEEGKGTIVKHYLPRWAPPQEAGPRPSR